MNVLEHVNDPFALRGQLKRILKKEGLLLIDVPNNAVVSLRGSLRHRWPELVLGEHINHFVPSTLKGVLLDVWQELAEALRGKITFHTFNFNSTDIDKYKSSEFAKGLPFVLEGKRGYRSLVRFLGECDGVINLTSGSILGRITFLAAALRRPGIFSGNSQLNARLYPGSCVAMFDTVRLRGLADVMLQGLANGKIDERLLPPPSSAEIGDFPANQARLREILAAGPPS